MEQNRQILRSGMIFAFFVNTFSFCLANLMSNDSIPYSELQEVTIMANRPAVKVRADKIIYNPSGIVSGGQGNTYDAIRSLPGITVGHNGEISMNGIQSISISFDGRKSVLNGEVLINLLKSLPVTDIENIEIISYAGAKADGFDPTTILNLVRRQKKDDSYSVGANIDGQIWKAQQIYGSAFGEYCRNGHGVSVNYSHYAARNPSELLTDRPYLDFKERLTQAYDRKRRDKSHHISVNYEYNNSSGTTVGTSLNYNHFNRQETAVMTTTVPFMPNPTVTSNDARFITENLFGEIYVKRQSSDKTSNWTAACDFFKYDSSEGQLMDDNTGMSIDGKMAGSTYGAVTSFDFNKSVSKHWQISAGARSSYVEMSSHGRYSGDSEQGTNALSKDIDNLGSSFRYNENVNALYAEGRCVYGILNASIGLRGEQSILKTFFSGNESSGSRNINRKYFHVYPALSVMLSPSGHGSFMLAYANKVTRPRFAVLDPFIHLFDDITHVGGNINLKESHRHSLSFAWSDNSHWRVMMGSDLISGDIVKYYRELSDRIVYVTPENIPSHLQLLFSVACSDIKITRWWALSVNGNLIFSTYRFAEATGLRPNRLWTPMIDLKNIIRLPYKVKVEMNASFRGKAAYGQAQISEVWNTYLGLRKDFFDGKLSLSMYIKDIFNCNHFKTTILLDGRKAVLFEKEYEDMRKIGLSISYSISEGIGNSKKEQRNAWIDELNRVNL